MLLGMLMLSCAETSIFDDTSGGQTLTSKSDNATSPNTGKRRRSLFGRKFLNPNKVATGTDNFIGQLSNIPTDELVEVDGRGTVSLNLVNVPIDAAAKAVLGEVFKYNYTIDPEVTGSVTLQTTAPITKKALLEIFQTILEANGMSLSIKDKFANIVPVSKARSKLTSRANKSIVGKRTVVIPLQNVGTAQMTSLLNQISVKGAGIEPIAKRNILLVTGSRDDVNAVIEAINLFDADVMKGKSVGLYALRAADPNAVAEELVAIFDTAENGELAGVLEFVPNQRMGSVLVVSSRKKYLIDAQKWIKQLDSTAGVTKRRPVVYELENRSATELAPVLSEMISNQASSETDAALGDTLKVVADEFKNAVVVWGNNDEQEAISRLIYSLDTTPVQVLLEVTISEVKLTDDLDFGLRWFFQNSNLSGTFSDASNGAVSSNFPGLSFVFQTGNSKVALNALSSITDVNVIATPTIMVVDNQEATLQIGDEVPIATQQSISTSDPNAPIVNTISFKDTGIILRVKPRVSSTGRVVLDIQQEVSSVSNTTTSGIDSPTISQRKIQTQVVVQDGRTLALGGLIQDQSNKTKSQVPGLGKVPVLGNLFKSKKDTRTKTELLILITPKVIHNASDAIAATQEFRRLLNKPNGLVKNGIKTPNTFHRIIQ